MSRKTKKRPTLHAATLLITKFKVKTVLQNLPNTACSGLAGGCAKNVVLCKYFGFVVCANLAANH